MRGASFVMFTQKTSSMSKNNNFFPATYFLKSISI